MDEKKNNVRPGDNVADDVKQVMNEEIKDIFKMVITTFSQSLKKKIPELPEKVEQKIKEILEKPEVVDELSEIWSKELYKKGLIPRGYIGLSDESVVSNLQQTGYMEGLFVGYTLAMMSLVDNEAEKDLIVSVRDDIRPNLIGHRFDDRDEFLERYKTETYKWVEYLKSSEEKECK